MPANAKLSIVELRQSARHRIDARLLADHMTDGDLPLSLDNISTLGFRVDDDYSLSRGDRVMLRLPVVGQIEAFCIWTAERRAGFQFERIIRPDEFAEMVAVLRKPATGRHRFARRNRSPDLLSRPQ